MADAGSPFAMATPHAGRKRGREDAEVEGEGVAQGLRFEKKARPTAGTSAHWQRDSVLSNQAISQPAPQHPKYDSDDQSSMMSEPGSPQDVEMSSDDDDQMRDSDTMPVLSQSPEARRPFQSSSSPWHGRTMQSQNRVPTPSIPHQNRPGIRPIQLRTGGTSFQPQSHHLRNRHPQENLSSDGHLEVPSPIDEDEVPTPPSAAEAAGSQLSMLTVNDMDIEPPPDSGLPTINVDDQSASASAVPSPAHMDSAIDVEHSMDDSSAGSTPGLTVRKPRQRSGAVSSGQGNQGSPSPVRGDFGGLGVGAGGGGGQKRGLSMGFRADCEKCRLRIPGHMNHFIAS